MLNLSDVSKIYRTDLVETHALSRFSLDVDAGDFLAIMGPSGSGKTTLLNILGLLDSFDEGSYVLDGQDVGTLNDSQLSRLRNQKIGFIFQSFNLIPDLDVRDNIDVPLRYRGLPAKQRRELIHQAAETVGLASRLKHRPSQLSGGQQQRVAIARALVGQPKIILADEPTGNLDSAMAREIMEMLERINGDGTTVVMVTHDPELARRAGHRLYLLDGRVIDVESEEARPLFDPRKLDSTTAPAMA